MFKWPTPYQEFIFTRTYARWLEDEKRRETWPETVRRYQKFFEKRLPADGDLKAEFLDAISRILRLEVMPSMRCLWTAGEALEQENIAGYNCAYTVIDRPKALAEILYILMCGTGVGFSVERKYIEKLPVVPEQLEPSEKMIEVEDSRLGWAQGFLELLEELYAGRIPRWDLRKIRPKGARLKTFGGRASGPEPLARLFAQTVETFKAARGRRLTSLEVHDIVCNIADCVVVGGVRRSATISLSDLDDELMRTAKEGEFWIHHPNRRYANNSAVFEVRPPYEEFMKEWTALAKSGTGERGIVNRQALRQQALSGRRKTFDEYGVNPCGEVILRPRQFCNLTEVVVRAGDTLPQLLDKVRAATILGVLQSTLTNFNFLDPEWKQNVEEERLLGVSLTGLRDHEVLGKRSDEAALMLTKMRMVAVATAKRWAKALGINVPAAVTCVKPSGTVSQLVNASSGLHPRYSQYYIRRVRVAYTDPLCHLLLAHGVPAHPEVGETWNNVNTVVFDFPVEAPAHSVKRNDESAIQQLEYWLMLKTFWCEHNPSATIYVKDDEWDAVGKWVWDHFDVIGGLTFLPYDGGVYQLAPYEEIDKETYERLVQEMPEIDFGLLSQLEQEDGTTGSREFACSGGACEL